jgi:hypothetical protein
VLVMGAPFRSGCHAANKRASRETPNESDTQPSSPQQLTSVIATSAAALGTFGAVAVSTARTSFVQERIVEECDDTAFVLAWVSVNAAGVRGAWYAPQ